MKHPEILDLSTLNELDGQTARERTACELAAVVHNVLRASRMLNLQLAEYQATRDGADAALRRVEREAARVRRYAVRASRFADSVALAETKAAAEHERGMRELADELRRERDIRAKAESVLRIERGVQARECDAWSAAWRHSLAHGTPKEAEAKAAWDRAEQLAMLVNLCAEARRKEYTKARDADRAKGSTQ